MWWWAEVSAGGTRSSGTVIFAMRARHSARRPHRTGASACRTRAVTLLRQPDIVGDLLGCRPEPGAPNVRPIIRVRRTAPHDVTEGRGCGVRVWIGRGHADGP